MKMAQDAIISVIESLGYTDFVQIVKFSTEAKAFKHPIYENPDLLLEANSGNRTNLIEFI